jgi:hypothetical protein
MKGLTILRMFTNEMQKRMGVTGFADIFAIG